MTIETNVCASEPSAGKGSSCEGCQYREICESQNWDSKYLGIDSCPHYRRFTSSRVQTELVARQLGDAKDIGETLARLERARHKI